jgi:hypothetical protein
MQIYAKGLAHIATEQTPFLLTQKFACGARPRRVPPKAGGAPRTDRQR